MFSPRPQDRSHRVAGCRLSRFDVGVIAACAFATWFFWDENHWVLILPVVLGHFFLFCNVFRIRSTSELIWAAVVMINFGYLVLNEQFSWPRFLACQSPLTVGLILLELFSKRYHGIGSRWINARHVDLWVNGELD